MPPNLDPAHRIIEPPLDHTPPSGGEQPEDFIDRIFELDQRILLAQNVADSTPSEYERQVALNELRWRVFERDLTIKQRDELIPGPKSSLDTTQWRTFFASLWNKISN